MAERSTHMVGRAKILRTQMTDAEVALWRALRAKRFGGVKFARQVPIGPYVADFAARSRRLIIELDGGQHSLNVASDAARTAHLDAQGFRVIRFWNNDVLNNLEGVLAVIARELENPLSPSLSPMGRGGKEEGSS